MKITGSKKKGKHLKKAVEKRSAQPDETENARSSPIKRFFSSGTWKIALFSVVLIVVVAGIILVMDVIADTNVIIKPPDVNQEPKPGTSQPPDATAASYPPDETRIPPVDNQDYPEPANPRLPNTFTFLVFGIDSHANTDVIMAVTFDAENYKFNVASIPRDTLVNVEWNVKKANQIVYNMKRNHKDEKDADEEAMKDVKKVFADLLGYEVDYWVTIDLKGFEALIDAIGGVDFNVPVNMDYDDPAQNLHIHYSKGMKYGLSGKQALEIVRFRMGYASKDIGRIETQQSFLKAAAEQILAKRKAINVSTMADTFLKYVKTDLALNNVAWLGLEFLKLNPEDVNFIMMPGNNMDSVNGSSYVSIYVDQWLEIVNSMLNPFTEPVNSDDVSILTRGSDRKLYVTDGNRQGDPAWGASSRGAGSP